ncbi:MAG TPA: hypothetical protein VMG11_06745 [Steroidobacteraceae bacterium]|nr:hypothetical protein [Steroidobacteraceae bacterium]
MLIVALVGAWLPLASAQNPTPTSNSTSVERAKECDARTQGKRLTDEQYRTYMRGCLASDGPPRDPSETVRTIEKRCNTVANERQLAGQERVFFMESCRRKS